MILPLVLHDSVVVATVGSVCVLTGVVCGRSDGSDWLDSSGVTGISDDMLVSSATIDSSWGDESSTVVVDLMGCSVIDEVMQLFSV